MENAKEKSKIQQGAEILPMFRTKHGQTALPMGRLDPTKETYGHLHRAYGFLNRKLFDRLLPSCLITVHRKKRAYGYFWSKRFESFDRVQLTDEIALNPTHFAERGEKKVLSTLAHEMVHLWQDHFGKPSPEGYHNAEWAEMMRRIGLILSDTGEIGGKPTGRRVSHFIEPGGSFDCAADELIHKGFVIAFVERNCEILSPVAIKNRDKKRDKKRDSKTRYSCPACRLNAWAKPDVRLVCGVCNITLA